MGVQEFQFKFMVMTIKATLDDTTLTVKQGLRTFRAEVAHLKHLYVIEHQGVGHELVLTHEVGPNKLKRIRFNSNFGEGQFDALIEALLARRPDIDIRSLSAAEAHKLMGATNWVALAPVIAISLIVGVVAVAFIPAFAHGLDSGSQTIDAAQCAASCDVETSNLTVRGRLLPDYTVERETSTTRSGSTTTSVSSLIPLVPTSWKRGDPVYLIIEAPDMTDADFDALVRKSEFKGVLRDIWWEGLSDEAAAYFKGKMGLGLADGARLLEYEADPKEGMWIGLLAVGVTLVIMIAVAFAVARKKKKQAA